MAANVKKTKKGKGKTAAKATKKTTAAASSPKLNRADSPTRSASACSKAEFLRILRRCSSLESTLATTRGDMATIIQEGEARHNLHRKAFKLARSCDRMDPTKLAEFLFHWDTYREHLELDAAIEDLLDDRKKPTKSGKSKNGRFGTKDSSLRQMTDKADQAISEASQDEPPAGEDTEGLALH